MHSLNPFLKAFFRSSYPSQCIPIDQHILLVPTTEALLSNRDRESSLSYADLAFTDDFLASHVLKIPSAGSSTTKDVGNIRENRAKARQFNTFNGRTVVIKESFVYSNKGFRNLNQAQLLNDVLYYQDGLESHQWLVYYISKPLVGTADPIKFTVAGVPGERNNANQETHQSEGSSVEEGPRPSQHPKKAVHSFQDVLANFPMIARQMQPGIERVINEFTVEAGKPQSVPISKQPASSKRRSSSASRTSSSNGSVLGGPSHSHSRRTSMSSLTTFTDDEENHLRRTLETAVIAAIDLFQLVDKQQLSLLGATTELTGPTVERFIERYVAEQLHHSLLFPRMCSLHHLEDVELEARIRRMLYVDISQVGIDIEGGRRGKGQITARINAGIEEFKKLKGDMSPQQMVETLLETQKLLTSSSVQPTRPRGATAEKIPSMTMNADTLVSLLLIVVIRAQVRQLQARLAYMKGFIFIDDVESGELGYALSTFEAVISYLSIDSGGLNVASRRNKRLWQATKKGDLSEMKTMLEPSEASLAHDSDSTDESSMEYSDGHDIMPDLAVLEDHRPSSELGPSQSESGLSHVFLFQKQGDDFRPSSLKPIKRVSIDLRSLSSDISFHSRASTVTSMTGPVEDVTSIDKLCQTQNLSGNSVLMMAVESVQTEALAYLLSLGDYFNMQTVVEDQSSEGTTLFSAAVQTSNQALIEMIVNYIWSMGDKGKLKEYVSTPDNNGRTVAHFLFQAPYLIERFGPLLPWRHKDKNGQTPLLALCRSYDHPAYLDMVNGALNVATREQGDDLPLHLDYHVDSKGNTLLHVVNEPYLALRLLQHCDTDPNAPNEKQFTPLMVASKFGRFDLVRALFLDKRVDVYAKEYRGMSAVELAKDDDVRNRMDDMVLVSNVPAGDGRVTSVVRSFFVEDATIRLIIKTAARSGDGMIAVTTCRRSLADFEHLAKWLAIEHPASWLPSIFTFRSPFQIPSKPSRAVLHDIQTRLDKFLKIMLSHSTFATHELLWEFILVPDIQPDMMAERSLLKAEIRQEKIKEEYDPLEDYRDVESFITHARESVRAVNHSTKSSLRRVNGIRNAVSDLFVALELSSKPLPHLNFIPREHVTAFKIYARAFKPFETDPYKVLHSDLLAITSTFLAILSSLARPHALIASAQAAQKALDRHRGSLRRSDRWPLGLLEETRRQAQVDAHDKIQKTREELRMSGCELRYTQQTVASELAGWQDMHGRMATRAIRKLATMMVVREKDRLEGLKRALRHVLDERVKP